jgi:hypothetical protein
VSLTAFTSVVLYGWMRRLGLLQLSFGVEKLFLDRTNPNRPVRT